MFLKAVIRDNPCTTGRRRRTASGSRGDLRGLAAVAVLAFLIAASLLPPLTGHASAAPSIEILSPTPNTVISGTVDVRVRYVDPTGIRQIWVSAGGQSVFDHQFAQYPTTYTVEMKWDTTKNEDGEALILCDGWNATNQYTHLTGKYTVNNAKGPSISWRSPRAGDIYTDSGPSTAKVDATVAKGQGSAVKKVSLFLDGKTLSSRTFTPAVDSTVLSHTLDVGALSNGSYELRIRAENTTGGMTEAGRTIYRTDDVYTYYLAEGSTDWGFSTYISIVNPNSTAVSIRITYQTKDGPVRRQVFTMAPESQATINTADDLGATDFSTRVDCVEGLAIAADRTMTWNAGGGEEGHCSIGVTSPAPTWYLPEGSSAWGFECWLLVQNPNDTPADCTVTYMIEGEGPRAFPVSVPGGSRATYSMAEHIGSKDASIKVESALPVIAERAMYRNNRRGGHDSVGTTAPSAEYFLAEGTTGYGFTTYVLVQNPNPAPVTVDVTYLTGAGPVPAPAFQMPANSRKTINVNETASLPHPDFSTLVRGSAPIIAERAMYWNNGTGEACHDSIGMTAPGTAFYLPDGQSSDGRETWTLVANPNDQSVEVEVRYLPPGGAGVKSVKDTIAPNSRKTYSMSDVIPSGRASVVVVSNTPGAKVMAERAMYWNSRGAGTDTVGGY